jgi:hypothetical protein
LSSRVVKGFVKKGASAFVPDETKLSLYRMIFYRYSHLLLKIRRIRRETMSRRRTLLAGCVILAALAAWGCSGGAESDKEWSFPRLEGPYLGQAPPGKEAELFAPGIVSTGLYERDMAITPSGEEIYYGLLLGNRATIMTSRLENGLWTEPEQASFIRGFRHNFFEPALSPDGNKLFFLTNLPPAGEEEKPGWIYQHIWAVDRVDDGLWGEPYDLGSAVNAKRAEFFPSLTADGTLYFTRAMGQGVYKIFRSRLQEEGYHTAEPLPEVVNGGNNPFNACISRDESFLIACVAGREDSLNPGFPEYYVFFRDEDDTWSGGINLGARVNFKDSRALSPHITGDGRYFFFGTTSARPDILAADGPVSWRLIQDIHHSPRNGAGDIYWVDAGFIRELNPMK